MATVQMSAQDSKACRRLLEALTELDLLHQDLTWEETPEGNVVLQIRAREAGDDEHAQQVLDANYFQHQR